jgi:uncharacterized protein YbbC (DUF1343 family)
LVVFALLAAGCAKEGPGATAPRPVAVPEPAPARVELVFPVMTGADVLEAEAFAILRGKRLGLLTHPAGVNRRGEPTRLRLHREPGLRLVALFAPEHGLFGAEVAGADVADARDPETGLPIHSLHGRNRKPTAAQLRGVDALVIDLQDIGVRSYTFNVAMRYAMDACFAQGVEVIVLDRPNPLGGRKVDGPMLDREFFSGVGAFPMPYVHGLTMGELARWAAATPGILDVSEAVRLRGRLTVVPMRGWRRSMRWPDTGLRFVPTSQNIREFADLVGYAMTGLGCEGSGFGHGIGTPHPFRSLAMRGVPAERLRRDLEALRLPGLRFRAIAGAADGDGPASRVWVEVADWEAWAPTELSFHLHRLACVYRPPNPFAALTPTQARTFNIHVGSAAWWTVLVREGANTDVRAWVQAWRQRADWFREQTREHWLYPE